jgi:Peptidase family M28
MKKNYTSLYSMLVLVALLFGIFYFMMPQNYDTTEAPLSEFSTKRALVKVKEMTTKPHYVGSESHEVIAQYLVKELQNLGLDATFQEGFTMTEKGTLVKSKNVLARIKGTSNTKALLLLSHYDSAPHSYSHGASDDASGVATILESVRAFLHTKTQHKNDIIILFSDAEELGLNGAALFVTQHKWAKEVGLVLNFEARGSGGPSYMLMETNEGNAKMVEGFSDGKLRYPVSNSLMYSIYKMLPNDTDLTVFRESGKIQGFNFAFIDNHFDYHTSQDKYEHLDPKTLAHQGTYLFPLLKHFSNADLTNLNSKQDKVYFSIPFSFVSYPFEWVLPMLIIALGLFLILIFIGLGKQLLRLDDIIRGFVPLLGSLIIGGGLTFLGWKTLLAIYPQYNDILHGFTYNGHDYIYGFVCLTLAICFLFYGKTAKKYLEMNQMIAPLFIWLLLNIGVFLKLKGAGFLIIPVISSAFMLGYYVLTQKTNVVVNLILAIPTLVILAPFIQMFPIGLGLKILVGSSILTVLSFVLLLPIFGSFTQKKLWATLFFLLAIGFLIKAHQSSSYVYGKAKPNSLVYVLNADSNKASWTTYDTNIDEWTKGYLGEKPKDSKSLNTNKLYSKYGSEFTFMNDAPLKDIAKPTIEFVKDSVIGTKRFLKIVISPNRKVNRYDIFSNTKINNLKANGVKSIDLESKISGKTSNKILSYYVVDNLPLELEFTISNSDKLDMNFVESSFDLMTNPLFSMAKRRDWMIPTPFVLTDAIVIKGKVKASEKLEIMVGYLPPKNSTNIAVDSLKQSAAD